MDARARRREELTALDGIAIVVVGLATAALLVFPVLVGAPTAAMFRDFGGELPALTHFTTSWYGPPSLAIIAAIPAALGAGSRRSPVGARRLAIVVAFTLALFALAVCFVGVYLPIFAVAGAVSAE